MCPPASSHAITAPCCESSRLIAVSCKLYFGRIFIAIIRDEIPEMSIRGEKRLAHTAIELRRGIADGPIQRHHGRPGLRILQQLKLGALRVRNRL